MDTSEKYTRRFTSRFHRGSDDECWEWLRGKLQSGYGQFWDGSHMVKAHRYSWSLHNGEIPEGMDVLHRCGNRGCVNPNHLYIGNDCDNMRDMIEAGRGPNRSKLYDEDVQVIRGLIDIGIKLGLIAEMFRVNKRTISRVKACPNFLTRGSIKSTAFIL